MISPEVVEEAVNEYKESRYERELDNASHCFAHVLETHKKFHYVINGIRFDFMCPSLYGDTFIIETSELFRLKMKQQEDKKSVTQFLKQINDLNKKACGVKIIYEYGGIHLISQGYSNQKYRGKRAQELFRCYFKSFAFIISELTKILHEYI